MPKLFVSDGKFGGLLLLAYERGVEHGEAGARMHPLPLAREEQRRIFHSWVEEQLRFLRRLNLTQQGESLIAAKKVR
jgi:hypothetical protein